MPPSNQILSTIKFSAMPISIFPVLVFSFVLFTPILSKPTKTAPLTPDEACNYTLYPPFCKSVLPSQGSQNISTYTQISISKALTTSNTHYNIITNFLSKNKDLLSQNETYAVEDCLFLADLTIDFLTTSNSTLNKTDTNVPDYDIENVHTLLSSALTNLQTCLDGVYILNQSSLMTKIYNPLANGTMLYSVTLDLFAKTWVNNTDLVSTTNRRLLFDDGGRLKLRMKRSDQELLEARSGRKLLQAPNGVLIKKMVVVSPDGSGNFTTIGQAVSSAPNKSAASSGYYLIYVTAGAYEEYVNVPTSTKYLMMVGDGINQTVITGNRSVVDGWTTFNSATFSVTAEGFVGINMTIKNTAGPIKHQAVALRNGADLSSFYLCSFEGYQDTLYTHSMRQFYKDCDIYGTVDFIFGNAATVLQTCNIYPRLPMPGQSDPITAQGRTDPNQNTGISIHDCNIVPAADLVGVNTTNVYLGRPWKEYSRTVVMQTYIDGFLNPAGWLAWSGSFALSTLYYAEFNNTGIGSNTSNRVTWPGYRVINDTEAIDFTVNEFLFGDIWLPPTGVPFDGELV